MGETKAAIDNTTLLELCGIPVPDCVQGTGYLSLLKGDPTPTRNEVYYEILMEKEGPERFPVPERGVRTHDWLYVRNPDGPTALFDLKQDPLEVDNLVDVPAYRATIERLDRALVEHMERTGDGWDIQAQFPPSDFQTHQEGAAYVEELVERAIVEP